MRFTKRIITGAILAMGLVACSGMPGKAPTLEQQLAEKNLKLGASVDRIRDYRLNGWNSLDRDHVIVHTGPSTSYLITLKMPCHNLLSAENIGFTATVGSVTKFDRLVVRANGGKFTERCYIESLHELEKYNPS